VQEVKLVVSTVPHGKNYIPNLFSLQRKINGRNVELRQSFGVDLKTNPARRALIHCSKNIVNAADVQHKLRVGKPIGALDRVMYKYLIYLDGKSFCSAILPMLVAGAAIFLPSNFPSNFLSESFSSK